MELDRQELIRYSRHLNLPHFGIETQQKLKDARVLIVGTGGLGAPLLQYLTAAGVGTIGVVDFDVVDTSNLQRQVLFSTEDVGKPKTATAINKLKAQNPHVKFIEHATTLDSTNAMDLIKGYDVVADGTDNFQTRYLVNDACLFLDKPLIYGSIFQYEGQVSVFNYTDKNGEKGPNYRDLFPTPPPPGLVPNCAEGGVLGVLPGIVGSFQANEVIKVITGIGDNLSGRLFLFDALDFTSRTLKVRRDSQNPITGESPSITQLIDYDQFCGISPTMESDEKSLTVLKLKEWMEEEKDFQLIDVREEYEYNAANLDGDLIPLSKIESSLDLIAKDKPVVIHCKSGGRSKQAIKLLETKFGYKHLLNLEGGILAWQKEVDGDMVVI